LFGEKKISNFIGYFSCFLWFYFQCANVFELKKKSFGCWIILVFMFLLHCRPDETILTFVPTSFDQRLFFPYHHFSRELWLCRNQISKRWHIMSSITQLKLVTQCIHLCWNKLLLHNKCRNTNILTFPFELQWWNESRFNARHLSIQIPRSNKLQIFENGALQRSTFHTPWCKEKNQKWTQGANNQWRLKEWSENIWTVRLPTKFLSLSSPADRCVAKFARCVGRLRRRQEG
jgi:hypothetical protein